MKLLLVLLLTLSIFVDFTSNSMIERGLLSNSERLLSCTEVDLHSSSEQNKQSEGSEHHNCHVGHFHNTVLPYGSLSLLSSISSIKNIFMSHPTGKTNKYLNSINRPPIS